MKKNEAGQTKWQEDDILTAVVWEGFSEVPSELSRE